MHEKMSTYSDLHYTIIQYIIDHGYAPDLKTLSEITDSDVGDVEVCLYKLQDYHGVLLHPGEPKVWVIHPFSMAPTNFLVKSERGEWWANCAWCSLGIAALLNEDVTITTSYGAHGEKVVIHIKHGEVVEKDLFIHFPIPMNKAWENVIYTCSTMLVFKDEEQIDRWCKVHHIEKGDIQPVSKVWEFSKKWYGNHLNPKWEKWTVQEAKGIFDSFGLKHPVWQMEDSESRF